jgi:hypothetical protein
MFVLKFGSNQNKKYHKLKIAVFRDIVQCYFVEIYRRFRGVCSHHTATGQELTPQGTQILRQCTVSRENVKFVTTQRENIRPSKNKMNKAVKMLKLPDVCN